MKYIITEQQNKVYLALRRRLIGLSIIAKKLIESSFYDDTDFCARFVSFDEFLKNYVEDIRSEYYDYYYENNNMFGDDDDNVLDFIGEDEFVEMLMNELGDELIKFYNDKTEDC
jgi:hypothetical protein